MLASWSYRDRDTLIQRLDARARVIFMVLMIAATLFTWNFWQLLLLFVVALGELLLARLSWRELRRFVFVVGLFALLLTLLTLLTGRGGAGIYTVEHPIWQGRVLGIPVLISAERLAFAAAQIIRIATQVILPIVVLFTIHPALYGVTFRRLGLSDNIAFALDLAVRFVPALGREFTTTLDAQRARGYELERAGGILRAIRNMAPLVIPVTIGAILKGEDVIDAMNLHAFGTGPRTWAQQLRYTPLDYAYMALGAALLAFTIACFALGLNGLYVPAWLLALAG